MKKFLTLAVVALLAVSANAQKGSTYIGTSGISFWNTDENAGPTSSGFLTGFNIGTGDLKGSQFGVAPELGYFVADNMAIGASVGFTLTNPDGDNNNITSLGIAPYFRYFLVQKGNFGLYLQAGGQYDINFYQADGVDNLNHFNVGVLPGISYAFSDKFSAAASFGWLGYDYWKQGDSDGGTVGLKVNGSSLNFGLYYNF
jgi:hypothetical protein